MGVGGVRGECEDEMGWDGMGWDEMAVMVGVVLSCLVDGSSPTHFYALTHGRGRGMDGNGDRDRE